MDHYINYNKYLNNDYSIVFPNSAGFKNEIVYFIKMLFYFSFKKQINKYYKNSFNSEKNFLKPAIFFSIINNLRFEHFAKYSIKKLQPKYIISTFEGTRMGREFYLKLQINIM